MIATRRAALRDDGRAEKIMLLSFLKKPKVELASIHIPKTAGTSFRNTLKSVYGNMGVRRIDNRKFPPKLPRGTRVIHGHFFWPALRDFYSLSDDTPLITWVRDPVDRVLSNYYYLQKILKERLRRESNDLNILSKMQKTLIEYASVEGARNCMSKFINGVELDRFLFVGVCEHFDEDVEALATLLGWREYGAFRHNDSSTEKRELTEDLRAEIRRLNDRDVAVYEKALELRLRRRVSG